MEPTLVQNHSNSNGSLHSSGAAMNKPSKADQQPTKPAKVESSAATSPPYWEQSHTRSISNISTESIAPGTITLQDNTDDKNEACWAKGVRIDDYVVISGSRTGRGAFVVWNVTVETLSGGSIHIRKRYSEFDDLRNKLLQTFPLSEAAMPSLPRKGVISKFRPNFLEQRRIGLTYFLNCILLNPEFSGSPVLKDFLFE